MGITEVAVYSTKVVVSRYFRASVEETIKAQRKLRAKALRIVMKGVP